MQNRRKQFYNLNSTSVSEARRSKPRLKLFFAIITGLIGFIYLVNRDNNKEAFSLNKIEPASFDIVAKKTEQPKFPLIKTESLSLRQETMLRIMKIEYAKQPVSYDATVLVYTEGFREAWCADFISWVRFQAGKPFENVETGYWRIPGVYSLRDYYSSTDAYHRIGEYTPKFGDVAFYFGETPDKTSSEHVAFVLGVEGDQLITLGGNEASKGVLRVRYDKLVEGERGLAGFGESNV